MSARAHPITSVQSILIIAMAVWGVNVSAVKVLTGALDPLVVAAVRMVVACVALTLIVIWKRYGLAGFTWRRTLGLVVCAVLMVYSNQVLFVGGLVRSTATNGALIMALSPLFSALLATIAFGEPLTRPRICGVLLGFCGVAAVVLSHPGAGLSRAGVGDLMLVASVLSFATGGALVQRLARHLHTVTISWVIYVIGTCLLVVHASLSSFGPVAATAVPDARQWALILFSGVFATAVSNLVWNHAISRIGVARTSVFLYLVPVFGIFFAAVVLDERLTAWHLVGFLAVMAGTYLGTKPPSAATAPAP
ncbi:MAG: DMT family transporter [Croceibacterium sp.]